jgi:hypothetical protein
MASAVMVLGIATMISGLGPGRAVAQGYPGYPYTIMAPEHSPRHRIGRMTRARASRLQPEAKRPRPLPRLATHSVAARGSSDPVLPAPLPRTPLIPPENGVTTAMPATPQTQGMTILPGLNPIPNLPHGTESFQDRASRCAFQQGLYSVPGNVSSQFMTACVQ